MAIAMDRRLLQGIGCRTHGLSTEWKPLSRHADADDDGSGSDVWSNDDIGEDDTHARNEVHHMQAAHTTRTNITRYGNATALDSNGRLTDTLLAAYADVSQQWHGLTGLPRALLNTVCGQVLDHNNVGDSPSSSAPPPLMQSHLLR